MTDSSTLRREKSVFVGLLRGQRAFLLKHAPSLGRAVCRRIKTSLYLRFASPQKGRKQWPHWLEPGPIAASGGGNQPVHADRLPDYPRSAGAPGCPVVAMTPVVLPEDASAAPDPEDYFAVHRWKFLLTCILNGVPDRQAALDQCRNWIISNCDRSDSAWEPYSACERVANLLVFLSVAPVARSQPLVLRELHEFVDESACWIHRHLEWYGPAEVFNHILNNARALVMAGAATGNERSFAAGMSIFRQCLPDLVGSGGFLRERSSHYQFIVLNWVLDSWRFCAQYRGDSSADGRFLRYFADRMLRAASLLAGVPGPPVTIGDVSPDAPPTLSVARIAFLYPDLWPLAARPQEGLEQLDGWFRMIRGEESVLLQFPAGAYPLGFLTHGHCDFTGFVWRHQSREVLADNGRYRYTPDSLSMFQKSAGGHNVPLVNGLAPVCETLVGNGQWWPVPYARARLEAVADRGGVTLSHTGYSRATPVTRHQRHIEPEHDGVVVVDTFEGTGSIELTLCWQFGEGFERFEAESMTARSADARVELGIEGMPGSAAVESTYGAGPGGWASHEYGTRRPALSVRLRWLVDLPLVVSTHFRFKICAAS